MAYNPITLDYDKSIQGEILKNKDELYQYRANVRAKYLDSRLNANHYNILTGDVRDVIVTKEKPKDFAHND